MCCFAKAVLSVTSTNIFGRLLADGSQYLAYQMKYRSKEINAMILPLPVATPSKDNSVEFIALEDYDDFFDDLNKGFPAPPTKSKFKKALGGGGVGGAMPETLKVFEVGDFVASFVPSMDDFDRLDEQFTIPKETWALIPEYADYGFAVFQLKSLEAKPHPMAFKFQSRLKKKVFFPTIHIHDGEVHEVEEFDHTLYLQASTFDDAAGEYQGRDVVVPATGFARSKWKARKFSYRNKSKGIVAGNQLVHRKVMKGELANRDVVADLSAEVIKKAKSVSQFQPAAPVVAAAIGLTGLGWLFNRRNEIQRENRPE